MVGGFIVETQLLGIVHEHLVHIVHLERCEDIVFVGRPILVAGQRHVAHRRESDVAGRKLLWQIVAVEEGIGELCTVILLLVARAVGIIAFPEQARHEVGGGLSAQTKTQTVVEVLRHHRVDGTYVKLARRLTAARLQIVLKDGLQEEDAHLKALQLLDMIEETAHLALTLCKLHLSVLLPELIRVAAGATGHLLCAALHLLLREGVEGEVGHTRRSRDQRLGDEVGDHQFHNHVIDRQQPFACFLTGELLHALHRLHPVHIAAARNGELTTLHLIGGVIENKDLATETEVLLVVGQEIDRDTAVLSHIEGVGDVITVELDGVATDGTAELMAQQEDILVVDIDIGEHVAHHRGQDAARLEEIVHTR